MNAETSYAEHIPFADRVASPFRDDPRFWRSVFASADMLLTLALALLAAILVMAGAGLPWTLAPFAVPAVFGVVAAVNGRRSASASRRHFIDHGHDAHAWRLAERSAVAAAFRSALVRNRIRVP